METDWEAAAAAFYALRGIRPADFLQFPLTEKIFLHAAMEKDLDLELRKLEILAGVKRRR